MNEVFIKREGKMQCECGTEMKTVPAGISKKTGKPYNAFYACPNCKATLNSEEPPKETPKPKPAPKQDEFVVGKKENTNLMCKKDLMVALINKSLTVSVDEVKATFYALWDVISE